MAKPNKSLGQHWLKDRAILEEIVTFADLKPTDLVLEIGPGLGTLTSALLRQVERVVAVEFDADLAAKLPGQFPGKQLEVISGDILEFNLNSLPKNYHVVANLPYYITSKIIEYLLESENPPRSITVLVQKEVAERLALAKGGSILGVMTNNLAEAELGVIVKPEAFTPPPKVNSQVVKLTLRGRPAGADRAGLARVVKAAFSAKRKKLRSSLSAGLGIEKSAAEELLAAAKIDPNWRAEQLSLAQFIELARVWRQTAPESK